MEIMTHIGPWWLLRTTNQTQRFKIQNLKAYLVIQLAHFYKQGLK